MVRRRRTAQAAQYALSGNQYHATSAAGSTPCKAAHTSTASPTARWCAQQGLNGTACAEDAGSIARGASSAAHLVVEQLRRHVDEVLQVGPAEALVEENEAPHRFCGVYCQGFQVFHDELRQRDARQRGGEAREARLQRGDVRKGRALVRERVCYVLRLRTALR